MTPTLKPEQAERLCDHLRESGWEFLGQVGTHRYWRRPNGSWRTEAQAFAEIEDEQQPPDFEDT